jgi:TRAP-type C4-dicarboxylate transport system permease small subunit
MYTDFEKKIYGKSKLRTKMRSVRNLLILLLGLFFITVAFTIVLDVNSAIGDGMKNIRYGLFAMGLVVSGTAVILALLFKSKK